MSTNISDYTRAQFISFMHELFLANRSGVSEEAMADLLDQFCEITGHPAGTDLIYYPEEGSDNSAEGIAETVETWRFAQGLPGFKQG